MRAVERMSKRGESKLEEVEESFRSGVSGKSRLGVDWLVYTSQKGKLRMPVHLQTYNRAICTIRKLSCFLLYRPKSTKQKNKTKTTR